MTNRLRVAVLALLILIAAVLFEQMGNNTATDASKQDQVMLNLFSLKTDQTWLIEVPKTEAKAALTRLSSDSDNYQVSGDYSYQEERGTVELDYSKITPLPVGDVSQNMTFVAPFSVSNQGSGLFWYLGMFKLDIKSARVAQLDSLFLGDRIKIQSLSTDDPFDVSSAVKINFLQHGEDQSMSETPAQQTEKIIKVGKSGFPAGY
ncbi:hypothetical protein [Vibrio sp. SCSIO 43137]|uniref:hypothetical protein n=1 Tax=Vibrio sp. SCSIO 43137 TaxID=3021011 RepID=UPI0023078301|nr:hypothetical protein [Vibrio sp. SCSIO 43137]WCE32505.1 hypothetical protein PK654_18615 [Vibrio sp. SCSIO 43137]